MEKTTTTDFSMLILDVTIFLSRHSFFFNCQIEMRYSPYGDALLYITGKNWCEIFLKICPYLPNVISLIATTSSYKVTENASNRPTTYNIQYHHRLLTCWNGFYLLKSTSTVFTEIDRRRSDSFIGWFYPSLLHHCDHPNEVGKLEISIWTGISAQLIRNFVSTCLPVANRP